MILTQVQVAPGVRLAVRRWGDDGDDVPILAVHGLASNAGLWSGMAPFLAAAGHPVIAVDQRGHGLSTRTDDGYDDATLTADLAAVLDAHGHDRALAMGQSWGGNVVIEFGLRHTDRCAGVVAVDGGVIELSERFDTWEACREALTPPSFEDRTVADLEAMFRDMTAGWPKSGVQGQLGNFHRTADGRARPNLTLDRHLRILRSLWEHHPSERLPGLTVPLLLLPVRGGAGDPAAVARALERTPRADVHWFDGHHDIHAQDPAAVAAAVLAHLDTGVLA